MTTQGENSLYTAAVADPLADILSDLADRMDYSSGKPIMTKQNIKRRLYELSEQVRLTSPSLSGMEFRARGQAKVIRSQREQLATAEAEAKAWRDTAEHLEELLATRDATITELLKDNQELQEIQNALRTLRHQA